MQFWSIEIEKQVQARVQIVLGDPQLLAVHAKFGAEAFRRSSVFHGLAAFLASENVRGKTCFEIGTWNGLTALVLSRHFERVISVDIVENPLKHQVLEAAGVKNVRCFKIERNEEKSAIAAKFPFDFAYMDGDHANDTQADFDLVRGCGRVLFHEVWPHQPPVWQLVHSLPVWQVAHGGAGLALWDAKRDRRKPA